MEGESIVSLACYRSSLFFLLMQVMMDYLQTVDNVLRVDPGVILESQMQNQSSTRYIYTQSTSYSVYTLMCSV